MDPSFHSAHQHISHPSEYLPAHLHYASAAEISSLKPATYCLFLGDLSLFCNEEDISNTFAQYGQLADVRIKRNKTTKRNLSYGFVEYLSMDHAVNAMNDMNGKVFCGRALRIRWATTLDTPKLPKPRSEMGKVEGSKSVSIYLAFTSTIPNLMINDESLRVLFGTFGAIEDVSIKQSVIDRQSLCQRGYAFVCFVPNENGISAAFSAANQMANCLVDGVYYRCEVSKSLKGIMDPFQHQPHSQPIVGHQQAQPLAFHHQAHERSGGHAPAALSNDWMNSNGNVSAAAGVNSRIQSQHASHPLPAMLGTSFPAYSFLPGAPPMSSPSSLTSSMQQHHPHQQNYMPHHIQRSESMSPTAAIPHGASHNLSAASTAAIVPAEHLYPYHVTHPSHNSYSPSTAPPLMTLMVPQHLSMPQQHPFHV